MIPAASLALAAIAGFAEVRPCSPRTSVASAISVLPAIRSYSRCTGFSPAPLSGRKEKRRHRVVAPKPLAERR